MTKQQIRTQIEGDWIDALEDESVDDAILWLSGLPKDAKLETEYYGYDGGKYGEIYIYCLETNEKESAREAKEAEEEADRIRKVTAKQLLEKMALEEKLQRLQWENATLHAYLTLHKDNPNIGDLENLMTALMGLERVGASYQSMEGLREVIGRLERGE